MSKKPSVQQSQDRAEFYVGLIEVAALELTSSTTLTEEQAHNIAYQICDKVRYLYSGSWLYVPKDVSLDKQILQSQILAEFDGKNHSELQEKHKVSKQYIYRLVKSEKKRLADNKGKPTPPGCKLKVQFTLL